MSITCPIRRQKSGSIDSSTITFDSGESWESSLATVCAEVPSQCWSRQQNQFAISVVWDITRKMLGASSFTDLTSFATECPTILLSPRWPDAMANGVRVDHPTVTKCFCVGWRWNLRRPESESLWSVVFAVIGDWSYVDLGSGSTHVPVGVAYSSFPLADLTLRYLTSPNIVLFKLLTMLFMR